MPDDDPQQKPVSEIAASEIVETIPSALILLDRHLNITSANRAFYQTFRTSPRETEGSQITVSPGFDASAIRLTGNVVGSAPFNGVVGHRGWRATDVHLPKVADGHNVHVLAPAEVEL